MSVLTLILAGGAGTRLSCLGEKRAQPAFPFAGKYRVIDFPLSNAVNSDLYRIAVLAQYRPHSLVQHIGTGEPWDLDRRRPNGVQVWQPYRGRKDQDWYRGTADALYQNRNFIAEAGCEQVLVLSGDHIYKEDYRYLLRFHGAKSADLTVAVMPVPREETQRFGIVEVATDDRITRFTEKPNLTRSTLASMGIYVFNTQFLLDWLDADARDTESAHDFGKDLLPRMVSRNEVYAYRFAGYWADVGTVTAYWEANLALLDEHPALRLADPNWVIHTRSEERPPVRFGQQGDVRESLVSNGCIVDGTVIHSVLSPGVRVERGAVVRDSVVMNDTVIRAGAVVDRCVLDKEIEIGHEARVGTGDDNMPNQLEPDILAAGITVAGKRARIPAGAVIGRNCRLDAGVTRDDFDQAEMPGGATISQRARVKDATIR